MQRRKEPGWVKERKEGMKKEKAKQESGRACGGGGGREGSRENQARRGPGRTCMVTTPSSSMASFLIWVARTCASSRMENSASAAPSPQSPQSSARHRRPSPPRPRGRRLRAAAAASSRPPPRAMLPRRESRGHCLRPTSPRPPDSRAAFPRAPGAG